MKKILILSLLCGCTTCYVTAGHSNPDHKTIMPEKQQGFIAKQVLYYNEHFNYKKITINDSVSSVFMDQLVKKLDPDQSLFTIADLKGFQKYRYSLDDDFRKGDLHAVFDIYNVYDQRFRTWINSSLSKLKTKPKGKAVSTAATQERKRFDDLLEQQNEQTSATVFQTIMDVFTRVIDPHTSYFNPAAVVSMDEQSSRTLDGIGAAMLSEDGMVKITDVLAGGPAFRSGQINAGDRIVGVAQADGPFESIIGWKVEKALTLIKGPKGSTVRLKILRSGQPVTANAIIVTLIRDKIVLEQQSAKKTLKNITQDGKTYKIGVIYVPAFYADVKAQLAGDPNYKSTTRDVKLIIDTLRNIDKADGIVIDLRGNGGGSLQEAIELTGLFIDKGPVVQMRYNNQKIAYGADTQAGMAWSGPLAVMVSPTSASASEIFSAAMQDYHRAIILGTQTYGKGTAQKGLDLNSVVPPDTLKTLLTLEQQKIPGFVLQLGELSLTYAKFYRITGNTTQLKGVMPDISFPSVYSPEETGERSYPSALKPDSIKAVAFEKFRDAPFNIELLNKLHQERIKKSYKFELLQLEIDNKKQNHISSHSMTDSKKTSSKSEQAYLAKINKIRMANGLRVLKSVQETENPKQDDYIMDEGARVLVDLISSDK